nr:ABC transporter permease [Thermodesulfobacterium hydrogeniphilum]
MYQRFLSFIYFCEYLGLILIDSFRNFRQFEWSSFFKDLQSSGLGSLGILGLLSFLIGIVIGYQSAVQLKTFGANIYIVNLIGISTFRELAPLITGIILAGRVSSGYTANIGLRKVSEEVDALKVLGLSPVVLLTLPRLISATFFTPFLTLFSALTMLLGGALVSDIILDINIRDFFFRLSEIVANKHFLAGMIKTPFFGFYIAIIGTFYGFMTEKRPESLGYSVMKSVVSSIAGIILIDAIFSIIFMWIKL